MLGPAFWTMEDLYPSCYSVQPPKAAAVLSVKTWATHRYLSQLSCSALAFGNCCLALSEGLVWLVGTSLSSSVWFPLFGKPTHNGFRLILWLGHLQILLCLFRTHVSIKYPLKFPLVSPSSVADVSFPTALPVFSLLSRAILFS